MTDFKQYLEARRQQVEIYLETALPADPEAGQILQAMRYSLLAGGKRLRAILCLAGAEAVGGSAAEVMCCAAALEMIHAYSLIHDDLPCMDDDDYRRGKPTNHKVFGESLAVLAGDGLLTQAMVMLCRPEADAPNRIDAARRLQAAGVIMEAAGYQGMVGGQALDILAEQSVPDYDLVKAIHSRKTGALIRASVTAGGILAGAVAEQVQLLAQYGDKIGLAFQIADDLLDLSGDAAALGKAVGSDAARGKLTYPGVMGFDKAKAKGEQLISQACQLAGQLGPAGQQLCQLANFIITRKN